METLLVKAGDDYEYRMSQSWSLLKHYTANNDVETESLPGQLSVLEVMLRKEEIPCFDDILSAVACVAVGDDKGSRTRKKLVQEVQTICTPLAVVPATRAAGECSFSSARRLKTWLSSRMGDERFSDLAVVNGHKQCVCIADVAHEFVYRNENRKRNFGNFKK